MKLTAAKCPNCNANIDVNPDLEKAICQYCGSTILIEDAVIKVKVEHSGKVKVEGIDSIDDKLDVVKKAIKIGNYKHAMNEIEKILNQDKYNIDANCYYIEVGLLIIKDYFKNDINYKIDYFKDLDSKEFINLSEKLFNSTIYKNEPYKILSTNNLMFDFEDKLSLIIKLNDKNEYNDKIDFFNQEVAAWNKFYSFYVDYSSQKFSNTANKKISKLAIFCALLAFILLYILFISI